MQTIHARQFYDHRDPVWARPADIVSEEDGGAVFVIDLADFDGVTPWPR